MKKHPSLSRSLRSNTSAAELDKLQTTKDTSKKGIKRRGPIKCMVVGSKTFKVTVKVLREIKRLQVSTHLLISKLAFSRLVHEIMSQYMSDCRIQKEALSALQEAVEGYLVQYFEDSYACALHARRCTLIPRDLSLIKHLRSSL